MKSAMLAVVALGVLATGCTNEKVSIAETAGSKVGEVVTDFTTGVGEGVDKSMSVTVELSAETSAAGLSKTVAKSRGFKEGISVYVLAEKPFTGQLVAKAVNAQGEEVGRSKVDVGFAADDARYVNFTFDSEMDFQLVEKYLIDIRPPSTKDAETAGSDRADVDQ